MTTANSNPTQKATPPTTHHTHLVHRIRKRIAIVTRWLHVYLSMVAFAIVLFFSVTGLTLNHPDWFAQHDQTARRQGSIPAALLHATSDKQPDKLGIVELLRKDHHVSGTVSDFRADDTQISIFFKGPGYTADVTIDPATGALDLTETRSGLLATVNDLHRGQVTGKAWSAVIDACAILLSLISFTGLILILFLVKRRTAGLLLLAFGSILCFVVFRFLIP